MTAGSRNGTLVNGHIVHGEARCRRADEVVRRGPLHHRRTITSRVVARRHASIDALPKKKKTSTNGLPPRSTIGAQPTTARFRLVMLAARGPLFEVRRRAPAIGSRAALRP